jgi:CubicO group peptidase (beta-lactamase class C family)
MKTTVACALLLALFVLPTVASVTAAKPEEVGLSSERLQRVTQMIQRRIAAGDLAGAVTIVARRGKVAHLSAQGVMDLGTKQPMTPATMFRIASMTKPVVGVSIMMLVEEGKVRLSDPVLRYIPEFRNMKVAITRPASGGSEGPSFYTVPAQREVTIKDLLTHVSGLGSGRISNSDIDKVALVL